MNETTTHDRPLRARRARRTLPAGPVFAFLAVVAASVAPPAARSATLHVDGTTGTDAASGTSWTDAVATITRALEMAETTGEPDTILVAAGTYAETLRVGVSGITLLGGHPTGGGARDPATNVTTVSSGGAGPGIVVSGADGTLVLDDIVVDGFHVTGGSAFVRGNVAGGAGVFVEEAAIVLTNNVIQGNSSDVAGGKGGGLYLFRAAAPGSTIRGNRFEGNAVSDGLGGGAWLVDFGDAASQGAIVFAENEVVANAAVAVGDVDPTQGGEPNGNGGGLFAWGGAIRIEGNVFEGNVAEEQGGQSFNGQGGALFLLEGTPVVRGNVITANEARAATGSYAGAGAGVYALSAGVVFADNEVRDNRALGGDGESQGWGGGANIALFESVSPALTNNLFEGNEAVGYGARAARGGGLYVIVAPGFGASATVEQTTLQGNRAAAGAGGAWFYSGAVGDLAIEELDAFDNEGDFASGVLALGEMSITHARFRRNRVHDPDGDSVSELRDNCRGLANPVQADADGDGEGDACDADDDDDGIADADDNCPLVDNGSQADADGDGIGDACQGDADGDGIADGTDNCPLVANPDQSDATMDGVGDLCEPATFDALETNASGLWLAGDAVVTNVEIVENLGQGLQVVGFPEDMSTGDPLDPASPVITNATIAENLAAGVITYLAEGTTFRDSIIALNVLSDRFDTEDPDTGERSSPNMICDHVNIGDGFGGPDPADIFCDGPGNFAANPRFVSGPTGEHYLEQVDSGGSRQSTSVDAGSRPAAGTAVEGRTTRSNEMADDGTVDLGWHAAPPPPPGSVDELAGTLRVTRGAGGVELGLEGAPASVTAARVFRGDLDALPTEPTHATPFTGEPGPPECAWDGGAAFVDAAALGDGRNWYYLAAAVDGGALGGLGSDSLGTLRRRPDDDAGDAVTDTCP